MHPGAEASVIAAMPLRQLFVELLRSLFRRTP